MVESDERWMRLALRLAAKGRGFTNPNPMVGAVVVSKDNHPVGTGYHERVGEAHAEVNALEDAGQRAFGGTLYCTLEPCCHVGRTGPCVERIVECGVDRVVIAMLDPNPKVNGGGAAYLKRHGVTVEVGVQGNEAECLNAPFITWMTRNRPFVTMKVALSLDGCIADGPEARTTITSESSNAVAQSLRGEVDVIAVGSSTALVDDPLLTCRFVERRAPLTRVVFDRRLRMRPTAKIFSTLETGPVIVLTTEQAFDNCGRQVELLTDVGARVEVLPDGTSLEEALILLGSWNLLNVVLEGGRVVHEAAWTNNLVDHVKIFMAPMVCGPQGLRWLDRDGVLDRLVDMKIRGCGPDILVEGDVYRVD